MENVTKSIIYGSPYENRYGRFLPVCSSICDRASIQPILDYLRQSPHFSKYNRSAYAYRVEQIPMVFITEKKHVEAQSYEGSHSDQTIEGSGDKLLHLLDKFNIRNVFVCILVQQFNPLFPFETTNYRAIVENCRLLLDELYRKVVALQDKAEVKSTKDLLLHNNQTLKVKKCNLGEKVELPLPVQKKPSRERPNHIYCTGKPEFLSNQPASSAQTSSIIYEIKFLWERCKLMKEQFQKLICSFSEPELQQLRYSVMYDKNVVINQVMNLLAAYLGVPREHLLDHFSFDRLKDIKFETVEDKRLKQLEDLLKANRKLNVDAVMKSNRPIGALFSLIEIKIRFSKTLKRISELMEKSSFSEKELEEMEAIKKRTAPNSFPTSLPLHSPNSQKHIIKQ